MVEICGGYAGVVGRDDGSFQTGLRQLLGKRHSISQVIFKPLKIKQPQSTLY